MSQPGARRAGERAFIVDGAMPASQHTVFAIGERRKLEIEIRRLEDDGSVLVRVARPWGGWMYLPVSAEQLS